MRRREFITMLGGAAAWPLAASAQAIPVIGWLYNSPPQVSGPFMPAFHRGLGEAGFVEGRNVSFERRSAEGQVDRLPVLAAELVRRQVAVIIASSTAAALAAKAATASIPIVFDLGSDPVKDGIVGSLNRPGANITGVTFFSNLLSSKRLQLLHELVPNAGVIGLLLNPNNPNAALELNETEVAARALGLQLFVIRARTEHEIDTAFAGLVQGRTGAVHISGDTYLYSRRDQIAGLALRRRLPSSGPLRDQAAAGILMTYGADRQDSSRQLGVYAGRILKGEKPADMPVVQPTRFDFVINLKTANAIGLTVPPKLLALADEVIE